MEKNANNSLVELLRQAACHYLGFGLSVIPTNSEKRSLVEWTPYRVSRLTEEEALRLFGLPNAKGIAVVCGNISGNLEVIDVDCKNDQTGMLWRNFYHLVSESLPELNERLIYASTVNKGYHLIYRCEKIEGNMPLAKNKNNKILIETRGEGGYFMVSPTPGYTFVQGDLNSIPVISPEERAILLNIAKSFDERLIPTPMLEPGYEFDGISAFDDYNQKADTVGLLVSQGWKVMKEKGEAVYLQRPGDTKNPVSAVFHSLNKVFYPFTNSTVFENKGYNPTGVYAKLMTNGDFSLASKQLYDAGYGDRYPEASEAETVTEENKIESKPIQPLPIEGFPQMIQDIINSCSSTYRTPRDFWAGAVLSATALGIGDKLELVTRYNNVPVLWLVLVGDVSSGKSQPLDFCINYFKKLDAQSIKKYEEDNTAYERISKLTKKERLEEGIDDRMAKPECFQYILNDFTPEAMVMVHKTNNRGILIERDELKGLFDDFGRYNKSGEQSNMISSWNRYSITYNRKTAGIMNIPKPCLSICGGMQPALLPSLAADSRAENGFLSRFCAVYPDQADKADYNKEKIPAEIIVQWEEFLSGLTGLSYKQEITLGNEAEQKYGEWFNQNSKMINDEPIEYLKGVYSKLDVITLRMAIIIRGMYLACDGVYSNEITGEEMDAAIALTEYFRATARKVYNRIFENPVNYIPDKKTIIKTLFKDFGARKEDIAKALKTCRAQVDRVLKKESLI